MTTLDMTNSYEREYFEVVQLKGILKLISVGLQPPRGTRKAALMQRARDLTGAQFGARDYKAAIKALEARRDCLLVYRQNNG